MNKAFQRMALPLALAAAALWAPVHAAQPPAAAASAAPAWGPGAMAAYHGGYGPGMMGGCYGPGAMARYHGGYGPGAMAGFHGGYGPGAMAAFHGGYGPGMMGGWHGYGPGSWMTGSNRGAYGPALSDAQIKRIRAIEKTTFERQWALAGKMHELAFADVPARAGSRIDVDALMKQATALSNLRLQMLRNRLEAQQQIDAVLAKAQPAAQGTKP
ncbi:hypothetical protein GALL_321940 [mine drainage metagenome]|uniref:Periplasmic heavy metal sensor n=1 Tax=mine drainage metagenome TaxID=410659 RepID=A0A1J5RCV1_9ZZZZ